MRDTLMCAIGTAPLAWLESLSSTKAALVALGVAFLAGAGAWGLFGEFAGHESRLRSVESWIEVHDTEVTRPRIQQIDRMQAQQDANLGRLMRIETLLSCIYYQIERCPDPAPNPPPSGRVQP